MHSLPNHHTHIRMCVSKYKCVYVSVFCLCVCMRYIANAIRIYLLLLLLSEADTISALFSKLLDIYVYLNKTIRSRMKCLFAYFFISLI